MKILLDENLPAKLRFRFGSQHTVYTVRELGWNGQEDGPLLQLLEQEKFDALVTLDKSMRYQQELARYPIVVFLLSAANSKHQTLQPLVEKPINLEWPEPNGQVVEIK